MNTYQPEILRRYHVAMFTLGYLLGLYLLSIDKAAGLCRQTLTFALCKVQRFAKMSDNGLSLAGQVVTMIIAIPIMIMLSSLRVAL